MVRERGVCSQCYANLHFLSLITINARDILMQRVGERGVIGSWADDKMAVNNGLLGSFKAVKMLFDKAIQLAVDRIIFLLATNFASLATSNPHHCNATSVW